MSGRSADVARLVLQELPCGHFMHSHCFAQYTRFNYSCPVCSKSMGDMSIYFGMLDSIVARDLADLPPAYRSRQQVRHLFSALINMHDAQQDNTTACTRCTCTSPAPHLEGWAVFCLLQAWI